MKRIVILGGSFNPVHTGHLRLALEMSEAFQADRLDFVPSFRPPHKSQNGLLPFEIRVQALRLALAGRSDMEINLFESELEKPSYSIYTLQNYAEREPDAELFFVLGLYDFAQLHKWYRWDELISHASLAVAARQGGEADEFISICRNLWTKGALYNKPPKEKAEKAGRVQTGTEFPLCFNPWAGAAEPRGTRLYYLPVPRLDISSSLLRNKWLAGQSIDFLTPEAVIALLNEKRPEVEKAWQSSQAD
ncbi:MAG: nicotinate (nicotinamide) nucleotide adenylyltransferase [Desulfovibrionaceae bacterium]|nr:nicotinate (nicotinamide) nucleotide adenylyltransferase [Desulfovibrionaceae bacterium]